MLPVIRAAAVWDRVPCQMRVSGGSLNLGMAEQLADHREALAQARALEAYECLRS